MPSLYALLVSINAYPPPIDPLDGCVNDADSMEAMLRARFDADSLHLLRLQDSAATRQAVIDTFRSHLGQAKTCDLALFFFAGHGSRVPTGGQFASVQANGMNSSIVCYDSRLPGGLDLVDKDMAILISEVTSNGAHLTTIFDSCHSGSMDRGQRVRHIHPRHDAQPADKYLAHPAVLEGAMRDMPHPMHDSGPITRAVAACSKPNRNGPHILLAACDSDQTAEEYIDPQTGKNHGAFTYFLTNTLGQTQGGIGYRELMRLVRSAIVVGAPTQSPKVESSGGNHMLDNLFLGFDTAAKADYAIAAFDNLTNQWQLDRGSTLKVAAGERFALYPLSALIVDLADPARAFALATVTQVQPSSAVLAPDPGATLDENLQYKAVEVSSAVLGHTATWKKYWALANPNTQIPADAVEFTLTVNPETPQAQVFVTPPTETVELLYRPVQMSLYTTPDGRPTYVGAVKNNGSARLYVALLYLAAEYSISTGLLGNEAVALDPGSRPVLTHSGRPMRASVADSATETTDYLLLIASTGPFDPNLFAMDPLNEATEAAEDSSDPVPKHDFFTRRVTLHITRSLQAAQENTVRRKPAPDAELAPGAAGAD